MDEYLIQKTTLINLADAVRNLNNIVGDITLSEILTSINEAASREDGIVSGSIDSIQNNRITSINKYSFYQNSALRECNFPLVINVGDYAFYKNSSLVNISLPLVESIGVFCFRECSSLQSISFPMLTSVSNGLFDECIALSSVNLPTVTEIGSLSFRKCEALTAADFSAVTSIGTQAFYSSGITALTLRSNTVVTLENEDAFYFTPIEDGTGYIHVPSILVDSYKSSETWSAYANQIVAIV